MIDANYPELSVNRQCELLNLNRSSYYRNVAHKAQATEDEYNLLLMRLIDELYTKYPFYGSRKMASHLRRLGHQVNRKRICRLMKKMGLVSVAPKPNTRQGRKGHKIYPYLLRGLDIKEANPVWCTDITYIRLAHGFVYWVAVMDWASRKVLSWEASNTMDEAFCVSALERALRLYGKPKIFNTDQGSPFTSNAFTGVLRDHDIKISMDGKGRALDNIMVERLWRSVKYEEIYLNEYKSVAALKKSLKRYFQYYNYERPHQSFGDATPAERYAGDAEKKSESEANKKSKMSVDKLMDDPVDNLMDNSSSCPQVNTQAAHELINDRLIE